MVETMTTLTREYKLSNHPAQEPRKTSLITKEVSERVSPLAEYGLELL